MKRRHKKKSPHAGPSDSTGRPPATLDQSESKQTVMKPRDWLLLAIAVPIFLCTNKLSLDLWHDESYTISQFVRRSFHTIVTDYHLPNNHIAYSLFLRCVYLLSDGQYWLRLSSLMISAGTLWLTFLGAARWVGVKGGFLAALALGLNPLWQQHTMQLRGYGLSMLCAAFLMGQIPWDAALVATRRAKIIRAVLIALVSAVFLYTLPTNVLFLLPIAAACTLLAGCLADSRLSRKSIWAAVKESIPWCCGTVFGGLLYLPVWDELMAAAGETPVSRVAELARVLREFSIALLYEQWPLIPFVLFGLILLAIGGGAESRRKNVIYFVAAAGLLIGPLGLALATRVPPFARNFTPLVVIVSMVLCPVWNRLTSFLGTRFCRGNESAAALAVGGGLMLLAIPFAVTYPDRLDKVRREHFAQDGYFNYYSARYHPRELVQQLADLVAEDRNFRIEFAPDDAMNLLYYFDQIGLPPRHQSSQSDAREKIYVIIPPIPLWDEIAKNSGIPVKQLQDHEELGDFGYYRLLRLK